MFRQSIRISVLLTVILILLLGVIYPSLVTVIIQGIFPEQARGNLITQDGKIIGAKLIGQQFSSPKYFWGRPSGCAVPYDAAASTGSNYGVNNKNLHELVQKRIMTLQKSDPDNKSPIPIDLVTASGSGLDPHISPQAANYQVSRVAKARELNYDEVKALVDHYTQGRCLGLLGEPVVNVLLLNLALDEYVLKNS